jgi:dTDP-6-deoxy-L-talose 4-dehydrogenase (NAD+)
MQLDAAIDRGDEVFPMSGGEQLRDYLRVECAAEQLAKALDDGRDGPVNICSGTPISVRTLVERRILERGARIRPEFGRFPYPAHEPLAFWGVRNAEDTTIAAAPLTARKPQGD